MRQIAAVRRRYVMEKLLQRESWWGDCADSPVVISSKAGQWLDALRAKESALSQATVGARESRPYWSVPTVDGRRTRVPVKQEQNRTVFVSRNRVRSGSRRRTGRNSGLSSDAVRQSPARSQSLATGRAGSGCRSDPFPALAMSRPRCGSNLPLVSRAGYSLGTVLGA